MLGGNVSTLAVVNSFLPHDGAITARLVPIARTPAGIVAGEAWQNVDIPLDGLFDWVDKTFPLEDDHAFIAPMRDIELLARVGWHSSLPETIGEATVLNVEDLPDDIADGLAHSLAPVISCGICRRLCVRDEFLWKEKQLCAWDYHATVFGRRGPWHNGPYEERHFETLPICAYVAPALLQEMNVEAILLLSNVDEAPARKAINVLLQSDPTRPHLAVRTDGGFSVLREM
ncbi:MAG: hypothetical protein JO302_02385 [Candidatus Eremiobacteraeota bacterium]|nr:hypothetical protein [Candidatus Eremiobacteraeota bacterium]